MFETIIEPRVSETDGAGHINNTTVPIWLEAGRNQIFAMFTPDLDFKNWRCIILRSEVDYVAQIYFGKNATVKTWVEKVGNTSFILYEEVHQEGILCAKGRTVYVNFNLDTQKTEVIPDHIREQLAAHMIEEVN